MAEKIMGGLQKRGKKYHFRMRVPARYRSVEDRSEIVQSLNTDSESEARSLMHGLEKAIIAELDARLAGRASPVSLDRYKVIAELATRYGVEYKTAAEIAAGPVEDALRRVEIVASEGKGKPEVATAVLGGIERPKLMLSDLVEHVEKHSAGANAAKNENQVKKWRLPRLRAVSNLIEAIGGDRPVADLTRQDALDHKDLWKRRIGGGEALAETANKDFTHMSSMLSVFWASMKVEDPPKIYAGLRIKKGRYEKEGRKISIPLPIIEAKILAPGALDGTNDECADIIRIIAETGCRQSEITDIPAEHIHLDGNLPFIRVMNTEDDEETRREVKNIHSFRMIPLVGLALEAFKRHPNGFPRYRGKGTFSAAANKYLHERGILPDIMTIGGLRHAFEDRLKAIGVDTDDRGELMGHSVARVRDREHYGEEMPMEKRLEIYERARLVPKRPEDVPAHVWVEIDEKVRLLRAAGVKRKRKSKKVEAGAGQAD